MNQAKWMMEAAAHNVILQQMIDDWIGAGAFSFWRFFPTKKSFDAWETYLRKVCEEYNAHTLEMYKSDVAGMVLVLDTCVVRTYRTARFLKIRPLYRLRCPFLEKCLTSKQLANVGVFVCRKIQPLVNMDMELSVKFTPKKLEQMEEDVQRAISKIHSFGYCHNDVSIDNTGYDNEAKHFVVFDFDAATRHVSKEHKMGCLLRDQTSWERSLQTWSEKLIPSP